MRDIRLYLDQPLAAGSDVALSRGTAAHALRVLRLTDGDRLTLFNGDGREYAARLRVGHAGLPSAHIEGTSAPPRESPLRVSLLQSLARGEKMDWIIQKATELGAARITPVMSARSGLRLDGTRAQRRLEHWRGIAIAACEQCGRNVVPQIDAPLDLAAGVAPRAAAQDAVRWMLHPGTGAPLRERAVPPNAAIELAVGPEGGFDADDLAVLRASGFSELALGPRILRTETAGLAALAALQALYGDS